MHYFESSAIHAGSYDAATQILTIWFTSAGRNYDYYGVPANAWEGLKMASSAGAYFNQFIRDQYAA